jgi:hypothetical protein
MTAGKQYQCAYTHNRSKTDGCDDALRSTHVGSPFVDVFQLRDYPGWDERMGWIVRMDTIGSMSIVITEQLQ